MDTFHINLSSATWGTETLYSGTVMKISKPLLGQRNTISMAESIARNNQSQAIDDILRKAENLDFLTDEIIFIPTYERITSIEHLTNILDGINQ